MPKQKQYRVLSYEERIKIALMLNENKKSSEIARELGRSVSTITREIKNYAITEPCKQNDCMEWHSKTCRKHNICGNNNCHKLCCRCRQKDCRSKCSDYRPALCDRLCDNPPYICNGCEYFKKGCRFERRIYYPSKANMRANEIKIEKSAGYDYTDEELDMINKIMTPLIRDQKQAPYAALIAAMPKLAKAGISLSRSTLYRMIERCDLDCRNIDLPEKVKRRRPKTKKRNKDTNTKVMLEKAGHMWKDYLKYKDEHYGIIIPQMDCVEGKRTDECALLTLFWKDTHLQIAFILDAHDSAHVVGALDKLEQMIGYDLFCQMLPAILTDNGQEFTDISGMERSYTEKGKIRTKIFFCEPNRSDQKGGCERNHREMRKIIPKGKTSLDMFDQADINLMMEHVNSYPRESLRGKAPVDVAQLLYPQDFLNLLGIERIPPDKVILSPTLLKNHKAA